MKFFQNLYSGLCEIYRNFFLGRKAVCHIKKDDMIHLSLGRVGRPKWVFLGMLAVMFWTVWQAMPIAAHIDRLLVGPECGATHAFEIILIPLVLVSWGVLLPAVAYLMDHKNVQSEISSADNLARAVNEISNERLAAIQKA